MRFLIFKITNLIKNGKTVLSIGDVFVDKLNSFRKYKCNGVGLHFILFEKIEVGSFEKDQVGKCQEFQTVHFLENELNLQPIQK